MTAEVQRSRGRAARRLKWRLAVYLGVAAAASTGLTAWVFSTLVERRLDARQRAQLGRRVDAVDAAVERLGQEVANELTRLQNRLVAHETELLSTLLAGGARAFAASPELDALTDLEVLTVLDARGASVTCVHWPERVGLEEPELYGLPREAAVLETVLWSDDTKRLTVLASGSFSVGRRELTLVGGRTLGNGLSAELGPRFPFWLFDLSDESGAAVLVGGPGESLEEARGLAQADSERTRLTPDLLLSRHELLGASGKRAGAVVVGVDRSLIPELRRDVARVFAGVGVVVTLLGIIAGMWMAGRIGAPVKQLVQAVDRIGAGEADYTFDRATRDELEELEGAFSRLQRSLETQRERVVAAERVAAWQEVARHVAHEVKNPLAPIRLTVENLVRARREDPRVFDELFPDGARTILEEVEQLRRLVGEFSGFARLPVPEPQAVDPHEILDGIVELYASEPGLQIVRNYAAATGELRLDPEQMNRALKNIVGNAVEAMREQDADRPRRLELRTADHGPMLVIEVLDSGPGLPPEAAGRVFQPYFTTKREGTGLGMAIAFRIITEHGGTIAARNRKTHGARIEIRLPREDAAQRSAPLPPAGRKVEV